MEEVDFTVLAAKSVFADLIDKCPPAETCSDAFDRTAKATTKMVSSTGGFGLELHGGWPSQNRDGQTDWNPGPDTATGPNPRRSHRPRPSGSRSGIGGPVA